MKMKAFSYVRVSGKGQIDGDGFKRQAETVSRYAKANRVEIVQEFRDEGVSGTNPSSAVVKTVALVCRDLRNLDPDFLHYICDDFAAGRKP
jgi:DNA invertase Pin-like site-specific DNA recombinase